MYEFNVFGYSFSSYWTMLVVGAVIALLISLLRAKRYDFGKIKAIVISFLVVAFGCVGAKLLYMLESPDASFSWRGGMSLFGSVILIPVGFAIVAPLMRIRYAKCMDFVSVCGPLFFAIMRIGCYLNDCCGGIEVSIFETTFTPAVQLIECILDILILILLLWREKTAQLSYNGKQYAVFMVCYACIRFFIEFWRDTPKVYFSLSEGQWLSVGCFVTGVCITYILNKKERFKS